MQDRFEEIDHSGDIGIEVHAGTREALFEQAALGLSALMVTGAPTAQGAREVDVVSDDPGDLLLEWLSEIISLASAHAEVYVGVRAVSLDEQRVRAVLEGVPASAVEAQLRFDVKAATYHEYVCERRGGVYHARVIFDL